MKTYLLLLRNENADFSDWGPADFQEMMAKYFAWAGRLREQGRFESGERLSPFSETLRLRDGKHVRDGPFSEGKEVIGGYYVLKADDAEEAATLCEGCPILEVGGSVELREIEGM